MTRKRVTVVVVGIVLALGVPVTAGAALCKDKKRGTLAVRDQCTKKQVAVDPATLGPGAASGGGLSLSSGGLALAAGGVTTGDLANGAVTPAKLAVVPAARVFNSSNQSTPGDASFVTLTFNSERFDTAGLHDSSGNPTRLTVPISGLYLVSVNISWDTVSSVGSRELALNKNGATVVARNVVAPSGVGDTTEQSLTTLVSLSAGDYIEVKLRQNSGTTFSVFAFPEFSPEFSMIWLSPAS
jgi:hypothetical protein